ncbi:MAG: lytic murein transglycosylase, partial [Thiobacillus sp.]|nr:lytic murein transglycosylase [Thiobacillus sp.]
MRARAAYVERKPAAFERAARDVPPGHVLAPYVEYWRLMLTGRSDDAGIAAFLARYPGTFMAEAVRADWLKTLGARADWARYLDEYPRLEKPDTAHQCYAYRAEWAQGNRSHIREAVALWFTGRDLPGACTPLFSQLIEAGFIREEDVWRRLRLALEAGNPGVARVVSNALPEAHRPAPALFERVSREPARLLASGLDASRRGDRELALYAIEQLARKDSATAARALADWSARLKAEERQIARARLATWAARRHEPVALAWFAEAGRLALNDAQREWWARAALRAGDWSAV